MQGCQTEHGIRPSPGLALNSEESLGYSLTGITSGMVLTRARDSVKTCGLFARDWPEWISVETAFHLDIDLVCLKESTFVAKLSLIYPTVTFISWEIGINLPPVNFVFCSQWIPPLTHDVWKCEMLEVLFAAVHQRRFIKVLDWVAFPITVKHSNVGGCSAMVHVVRSFVKIQRYGGESEDGKTPGSVSCLDM
jgi:hypothetical protein